MEGAPFAYLATERQGGVIAVSETLHGVVRRIKQLSVLTPEEVSIQGCFPDGRQFPVAEHRYSSVTVATRMDALDFIHKRECDVADAPTGAARSFLLLRGIHRCNPDDSIERQIESYVRTSPRTWKECIED